MSPIVPRPYRDVRMPGLAGGINDSFNETLLRPDETPDSLNIEYNRRTVQTGRGAIKLNNQTAPRSAIRTRIDRSFSPLYIQPDFGVPLRGYGYLPYAGETDIGGNFAEDL